jgi:hypothetical protein
MNGTGDSSSTAGIVTVVNNNLSNSISNKSLSNKRIDLVGSNSTTNLRNINNYPEIKVCEFIGYPKGTQLGLVVTSDDYSHDVVKVAEESPAARVGIVKGSVN